MYMKNVHNKESSLWIDPSSERPVVEQIISGLRQQLLSHALRAGDRLPSSRALARDLGVHFNTVAQAYRVLEAEGWLALQRRKGTVVLERPSPELTPEARREMADNFSHKLEELLNRYEAQGLEPATLAALSREIIGKMGKAE